jgi:LPXTG-site transpeptidase (sortase) family protein
MSKVKNTISNTPLLLRVVCLYVVASVPILALTYTIQAAPVAAIPMPKVEKMVKPVLSKTISGHPVKISIKRLGINLPVVDGKYNAKKNTWTLRDNAAQYATMTDLPNNERGNTIIYGHNTVQVLEPVRNIMPGDVLKLTTKNGRVFSYVYMKDSSVAPDKTNILTRSSSKPKLTLMTCEGFFSETRRLLYFKFTGVA